MPKSTWKIDEIRKQVAVIDGNKAPTIVLKNARYLHSVFKQWLVGNIWILADRIVYVGKEMPSNLDNTEVMDLEGKVVVPVILNPMYIHSNYIIHTPLQIFLHKVEQQLLSQII